MYCRKCGNRVRDNDRFCTKCGVKLKDEAKYSEYIQALNDEITSNKRSNIGITKDVEYNINEIQPKNTNACLSNMIQWIAGFPKLILRPYTWELNPFKWASDLSEDVCIVTEDDSCISGSMCAIMLYSTWNLYNIYWMFMTSLRINRAYRELGIHRNVTFEYVITSLLFCGCAWASVQRDVNDLYFRKSNQGYYSWNIGNYLCQWLIGSVFGFAYYCISITPIVAF